MKRYLIVFVLALAGVGYVVERTDIAPAMLQSSVAETSLEEAFEDRRSDVQVQGHGRVVQVLADDNRGSRHQRFILRLPGGQTVLVAHNIDLAPRIPELQEGDHVAFHGEYEWNEQGGVVHWTHHDPAGRHVDGWLEHDNRRYR
ncbi:DUF3465 domain-containing protein [Halomonas shantousis]